MCILLKLHYSKFDVSSLFFSNVIEEKPLGGRLDPPPLGKGRVKKRKIDKGSYFYPIIIHIVLFMHDAGSFMHYKNWLQDEEVQRRL